MESKFHFIGAGISLAIGISILACGGGTNTGGGEPCTFDSECSIGQVCSQDLNVCEETCVDSNDCFAGESCLPRPNADGNTCQFDSTGGDTDMGDITPGACTDNEQCTPVNGVEGVCFNGMCDYPTPDETTYRWIMIADESSGDDACDQTDPGSDIMGVRLLDSSGQLIGWGDAGNENLGTSGSKTNKYDTTARLDGQPNGLSSQSCPESGSRLSELTPPPLSLGCGGWVLINFLDNGTPVDIENGHRIEVLEYGSTCGGSAFDKYSVYICTETASAQGGSDATCDLGVGGQTEGFGSVTVDI